MYCNISEGTAFLLQDVTENDSSFKWHQTSSLKLCDVATDLERSPESNSFLKNFTLQHKKFFRWFLPSSNPLLVNQKRQTPGIKAGYDTVTSCKNVISIDHNASAVFVPFLQVLPFRERKSFIRFCIFVTVYTTSQHKITFFQNFIQYS